MPEYRLTPDAEDDLSEIARYTAATWGAAQARRYQTALVRGFEAVAQGAALSRQPLPHRPGVRCHRCEHHFIFSIHEEEDESPVIVAVLHENMDLLMRLRNRLESYLPTET